MSLSKLRTWAFIATTVAGISWASAQGTTEEVACDVWRLVERGSDMQVSPTQICKDRDATGSKYIQPDGTEITNLKEYTHVDMDSYSSWKDIAPFSKTPLFKDKKGISWYFTPFGAFISLTSSEDEEIILLSDTQALIRVWSYGNNKVTDINWNIIIPTWEVFYSHDWFFKKLDQAVLDDKILEAIIANIEPEAFPYSIEWATDITIYNFRWYGSNRIAWTLKLLTTLIQDKNTLEVLKNSPLIWGILDKLAVVAGQEEFIYYTLGVVGAKSIEEWGSMYDNVSMYQGLLLNDELRTAFNLTPLAEWDPMNAEQQQKFNHIMFSYRRISDPILRKLLEIYAENF